MTDEFISYGGTEKNLGTCYECHKNNPAASQDIVIPIKKIERRYDPNKCPECGGMLRTKQGRYGSFVGCSNYPSCKYTR